MSEYFLENPKCRGWGFFRQVEPLCGPVLPLRFAPFPQGKLRTEPAGEILSVAKDLLFPQPMQPSSNCPINFRNIPHFRLMQPTAIDDVCSQLLYL